jgi:hypothetical protein
MKKLASAINGEYQDTRAEKVDLSQINDLVLAIDQYLDSEIKPVFKKSTGFSPSEKNTCHRFWWYKFHGVEFPVTHDARVQRIFDVGHAVHSRIVSYFDSMGVLLEVEHPVPQKDGCPPISGFIDAIIDWDGPVVVEIKSISHEGFMLRNTYSKPSTDHYRQIQWYMHYTDIHRGIVIYECKNTQRMMAFKVKYDEDFCSKLIKQYGKIYKKAIEETIPERPSAYNSDRCQGCRLLTVCWDGEEL